MHFEIKEALGIRSYGKRWRVVCEIFEFSEWDGPEVLDGILKAFIEDKKAAKEIIQMGFEPSVVRDIIRRVDKNEYKRH